MCAKDSFKGEVEEDLGVKYGQMGIGERKEWDRKPGLCTLNVQSQVIAKVERERGAGRDLVKV